jgi:hypothetical protein
MTRAGAAVVLLAVGLAACGGKPPPAGPPANAGAPPAENDPPCPSPTEAAPLELADGAFRCRQLPVVVDFPPGTKLVRENQGTLAMFRADRERGILALIVEPRVIPLDVEAMDKLLDSAVAGLAPDAKRTSIEVPAMSGASVARGFAFTTPDGGSGVIRGYYTSSWLVAIIAGGRLVGDPARPDEPAGKAFLASLQLRPLPSGMVPLPLVDGAVVDVPATVWDAGALPGDEVARFAKWWVVAERRAALGVRVLDAGDLCTRIRLTTPTELGQLVDATFLGDGLTSDLAVHVERGAYFEAVEGHQALASSVVCLDPVIVQVVAVGDPPTEPLKALVEEIAATVTQQPPKAN